VLYVFYNFLLGKYDLMDSLLNLPKSIVIYIPEAGHLWFIYELLGLYLYAPILSPWVYNNLY
jgi:surface polysaccharide O-acyltransferase-like enzyme